MKTTTGNWVVLILSLISPLLYLSMYLPIWNGIEISLANAGVPAIILFVFQCICLALAILQLLFVNLRNTDSCLLASIFLFCSVTSLVLTCYFGFVFVWAQYLIMGTV